MPDSTKHVSKVVYDGRTLIDLTGDTITADQLHKGITAHGKDGAPITGTDTRDSDTSSDTAAVGEILSGKTAHARGTLLTGTMPNRGANGVTVSSLAGTSIPQGYYDGSGKATIDSTNAALLVAGNIKQGVTVLGVEGTYAGEITKLETKDVTPTTSKQTITVSEGYDAISSVTVEAIPYAESDNTAGGITVTIAGSGAAA